MEHPKINSNLVGAILGEASYMSDDQALRSMVREYHGAKSEFVSNAATEHSLTNKEDATFQYEMESGETVANMEYASIEDWAGEKNVKKISGKYRIFLLKCHYGKRNDENPEFDLIYNQPVSYSKIQFLMYITGFEDAVFYQWSPHGSVTEYVKKDQEWLDKNLPDLRQFYAYFLSELDNPEHLEELRKEVNTEESKRLIDELEQLKEAEDNAKERRKEVEKDIVKLCDGKNSLMWGKKVSKVTKAGNVAYAKIVKEKLPDLDLKEYRGKESTYWKIS